MSPLKENDDDERWSWLRGDEDEDAESAYTASEEDPTVPPTPVEYDESENPDRVIQREDKLGILRLREYQTTVFSISAYHHARRETLDDENHIMTDCRYNSSSFLRRWGTDIATAVPARSQQ